MEIDENKTTEQSQQPQQEESQEQEQPQQEQEEEEEEELKEIERKEIEEKFQILTNKTTEEIKIICDQLISKCEKGQDFYNVYITLKVYEKHLSTTVLNRIRKLLGSINLISTHLSISSIKLFTIYDITNIFQAINQIPQCFLTLFKSTISFTKQLYPSLNTILSFPTIQSHQIALIGCSFIQPDVSSIMDIIHQDFGSSKTSFWLAAKNNIESMKTKFINNHYHKYPEVWGIDPRKGYFLNENVLYDSFYFVKYRIKDCIREVCAKSPSKSEFYCQIHCLLNDEGMKEKFQSLGKLFPAYFYVWLEWKSYLSNPRFRWLVDFTLKYDPRCVICIKTNRFNTDVSSTTNIVDNGTSLSSKISLPPVIPQETPNTTINNTTKIPNISDTPNTTHLLDSSIITSPILSSSSPSSSSQIISTESYIQTPTIQQIQEQLEEITSRLETDTTIITTTSTIIVNTEESNESIKNNIQNTTTTNKIRNNEQLNTQEIKSSEIEDQIEELESISDLSFLDSHSTSKKKRKSTKRMLLDESQSKGEKMKIKFEYYRQRSARKILKDANKGKLDDTFGTDELRELKRRCYEIILS